MEKFWKLLAGCLAGLACFSCAPQMPDNYTESTDAADIYPDYRDVTVPPNIAPLRFIVDEEADAYAVRISGPDGEWTTDKREVTPGVDEWHDMTARARGRALDVEVFVKHLSMAVMILCLMSVVTGKFKTANSLLTRFPNKVTPQTLLNGKKPIKRYWPLPAKFLKAQRIQAFVALLKLLKNNSPVLTSTGTAQALIKAQRTALLLN